MDERAWDAYAKAFDEAILNVPANDRAGRIRACIDRLAGVDRSVADIGCGVGRALDLLTPRFGTVYATDLSRECLAIAHRAHALATNIRYIHADLAQGHGLPGPVDLVLCINTLLQASLAHREAMWRHLCSAVRPEGHLLVVVPSLESALYVSHRLVRLNRRSGLPPKAAQRKARREMSDLDLGIVQVDGVPTKHHLKEELHDVLQAQGMVVVETRKLEYPWGFALEDPPLNMAAPMPWNWMVLARRTTT
ncbi:MAG: methyltransferase domain-containing protein [Flavobacteriales bacterium]|nr:methyltransferase domain-containing protein [Flavobacteriales bacterium]